MNFALKKKSVFFFCSPNTINVIFQNSHFSKYHGHTQTFETNHDPSLEIYASMICITLYHISINLSTTNLRCFQNEFWFFFFFFHLKNRNGMKEKLEMFCTCVTHVIVIIYSKAHFVSN